MTTIWRDRLVLVAPFLAVGLLAVLTPNDDGPTVCAFALCTGSACPGCGLTRAASSLIRGDFGSAMVYHPLVLLITLQTVGAWIWFLLRRSGRVAPMSQRTLTLILGGTALALVLVWVVRLVTGTLPPV
ncbi:MAG: DUF2752 domain-containing protein [Acidimicrobiia bacterium]